MKTRLSAMAVVISSISMLTACGGSGPGSFTSDTPTPTTPTPTPTPTVTVTAPATATAGFAFQAGWTSTDATSCDAGDLSTVTDPNPTSFSKTETTAGTKTYSVTCTGKGGSATGTATVVVSAAPTAEGAWQGPTDDHRTISGVVLAADASLKSGYWLTYTQANSAVPAGFIAGIGTSAPNYSDTTASSGTFSSSNLKEFNFAGGSVNGNGTLASPYAKKASLGTASSPANMSGASSYTVTSVITPSDNSLAANAPVLFTTSTPFSGTATLSSAGVLTLDVSGSMQMDASQLGGANYKADVQTLEQLWKFNTTTDSSGTHLVDSTSTTAPLAATDSYVSTKACVDAPAALYKVCGAANNVVPFYPLNPDAASYFPLFDNYSDPTYYTSQVLDLTAAHFDVWGAARLGGLLPYEFDFTLTPSGGIAAAARTFNSAYSAAYDTAPVAIAGSYTATPAYTGINSSMYTNTTTFSISSGGAIAGAELTSNCSYSGTIAPHATGNVYDVTALTFTGGSCAYTSSGTFTGVATYDATAKTLTLTALDSTRSKGFMVVATQP